MQTIPWIHADFKNNAFAPVWLFFSILFSRGKGSRDGGTETTQCMKTSSCFFLTYARFYRCTFFLLKCSVAESQKWGENICWKANCAKKCLCISLPSGILMLYFEVRLIALKSAMVLPTSLALPPLPLFPSAAFWHLLIHHAMEKKQCVWKKRCLCFPSLACHACRSVPALWKEGKQEG